VLPRRTGVWVEGMSLRRDIDQRSMWAFADAASRAARVRPPLALPFSHDWLLPGGRLDDEERETLQRVGSVNGLLRQGRFADAA
jgi:hypothetical protein